MRVTLGKATISFQDGGPANDYHVLVSLPSSGVVHASNKQANLTLPCVFELQIEEENLAEILEQDVHFKLCLKEYVIQNHVEVLRNCIPLVNEKNLTWNSEGEQKEVSLHL